MTDVRVRRWRKGRQDRVYFTTPGGVQIGWLNCLSGEQVIEEPDLRDAFEAAVAQFVMNPRRTAMLAPSPRCADSGVASSLPAPTWVDLAQNKPGQAARAKAVAIAATLARHSSPQDSEATIADLKEQERNWRVGADGEEAVGLELAASQDLGWRILHAVQVGKRECDIDHVAIGPGGVFTLNTKTHLQSRVTVYERAFLVAGFKQSYLPDSTFEARRATRLLTSACGFDVQVSPVIVVLCDQLDIRGRPTDVHVVRKSDIAWWLRHRPTALTQSDIDSVWEFARRSTTWQE